MTKPIGYFSGYEDPAIEKFAAQFEKGDGDCNLSDNDQAALVCVLAQHGFGCQTGLEDDFWQNVDNAIGDGVETSLETEEPDAPLAIALDILQTIEPHRVWCLISWLTQ